MVNNTNCQVININLNKYHNIYNIIFDLSLIDYNFSSYIFNIEYTCSNFVDPDSYLIIVAIINELKSIGKGVHVNFNTSQECSTIKYASRINFFKHVGIDYEESFIRRNTSVSMIEITHICNQSYSVPDHIVTIFESNFGLKDPGLYSFIVLLNELICNMTIHSQSNNGGYMYCQRFPKKNIVNIIFVDCGIGIKSTLNKLYPFYDNGKCLIESIKKEVTCGNGRGLGLYYFAELLKINKGNFNIISQNNSIFAEPNSVNLMENANWKGTIIKGSFNLNEPLDMNSLLI